MKVELIGWPQVQITKEETKCRDRVKEREEIEREKEKIKRRKDRERIRGRKKHAQTDNKTDGQEPREICVETE